MKLYLFPQSPSLTNGYGIAVNSDYNRLVPQENDLVVWYTFDTGFDYLHERDVIIKRPHTLNLKRLRNLLMNKCSTEISHKELSFLKDQEYDDIFCGDVVFYRALRAIFPDKQLTVRFHNCFSRIFDRKKLLDISVNWKLNINLHNYYSLEKEIFNDRNVKKIFISQEDCDYYTSMTGYCSDAEVWSFYPDKNKLDINREVYRLDHKLVWFGGIEIHKKDSIDWFINDVFSILKKDFPDVEFHLWGRFTEQFNNPANNVFGHGFYQDSGFPLKGKSLYVNPDIIGGGVKIKLLTYLEEGVPFISSPFGFEGYSKELIDNQYCFVAETGQWVRMIKNIFDKNSLVYLRTDLSK